MSCSCRSPRRSLRVLAHTLAFALCALPSIGGPASAGETAEFGRAFPGGIFDNLNVQAGGPPSVDLREQIGKKPVLLFYWIAGNPRADEMFTALQDLVGELGPERIALFGVALERPGREADTIKTRLHEIGIRVPVLDDKVFKLGSLLRIQSVPNLTIIDGQGNLRLTNGAALSQDIEYKLTLEGAVRRVAEKGTLGTYGYLERYYPVTEMVGEKSPDFEAPLLTGDQVQSWHGMLSREKLNVLIFWSIDCPHCRTMMPEIAAWARANPGGANLVSVVRVDNEANRVKTREFCAANEVPFPTLVDRDMAVAKLFQVTSTPTTLIVRPDGVIDAVLLSSTQDLGRAIEEKRRALLGR